MIPRSVASLIPSFQDPWMCIVLLLLWLLTSLIYGGETHSFVGTWLFLAVFHFQFTNFHPNSVSWQLLLGIPHSKKHRALLKLPTSRSRRWRKFFSRWVGAENAQQKKMFWTFFVDFRGASTLIYGINSEQPFHRQKKTSPKTTFTGSKFTILWDAVAHRCTDRQF